MKMLSRHLLLAALPVAMLGCASSPIIAPSEETAARITDVGEPFTFQVNGEPIEMPLTVGEKLSFPEAVRLCLKHDALIQGALARVRAAAAEAHQARLIQNPLLNVSLRFPESGGTSIIDAGLSTELLSVLTMPGRISVADNKLLQSSSAAMTTVLNTLRDVSKTYASVQALDARVIIVEARGELLRELSKIARARVEAGEASRLDTLTVESEQATLDAELIELRSERRQARLSLARLVGSPLSSATFEVDAWKAPGRFPLSESEWIASALGNRPEIQEQIFELNALGYEVKLSALLPFAGTAVGVDSERDGEWSVGPALSIPIPLFDFGQAHRELLAARQIEARHKLTQQSRLVAEDVRRSIVELVSAYEALDVVTKKLLPIQEERRAQLQDAYKLGLVDITSVRLAEQDLQASRSKAIELEEKVSGASFDLERAVGGSGIASKLSSATKPTTKPN